VTGTERAALRLALGVLRDSVRLSEDAEERYARDNPWRDALADSGLTQAARVLGCCEIENVMPVWPWGGRHRVLRARLALYLRTVLRAESAKDRYPYGDNLRPTAVVTACIQGTVPRDMRPAGDGWWLHEAITPNIRNREYEWRRWPVPLWSQAPRSKP